VEKVRRDSGHLHLGEPRQYFALSSVPGTCLTA
jgi:hypothetical protein